MSEHADTTSLSRREGFKKALSAKGRKAEDSLALFFLAALVVFPFSYYLVRVITGATFYVSDQIIQVIMVFLSFIGATIATRESQHLTLIKRGTVKTPWLRSALGAFSMIVTIAVTTIFLFTSLVRYIVVFKSGDTMAEIPSAIVYAVIPVCLVVIIARFYFLSEVGNKALKRASGIAGVLIGVFASFLAILIIWSIIANPSDPKSEFVGLCKIFAPITDPLVGFHDSGSLSSIFFIALLVAVIGSCFAGSPIFAILLGITILLTWHSGIETGLESYIADPTISKEDLAPILAVLSEERLKSLFSGSDSLTRSALNIIVNNTKFIPPIALFTLAGYILAASGAGKRLVGVFRALLGWLPGGLIIVTIVLCTVFTTFTGATGITILALGPLLYTILAENSGYKGNFARGLITGSGSIGILFPPSIILIMYADKTNIARAVDQSIPSIEPNTLLLGTLVPGLILVIAMIAFGIIISIKTKVPTTPFSMSELGRNAKIAWLEILLPVVLVVCFSTGVFFDITEMGAFTVLYVIVAEVFFYKDLKLRDLASVAKKALPFIGGILFILCASQALAEFILNPSGGTSVSGIQGFINSFIHTRFEFLLMVNVLLLLVGGVLDVFPATNIVAPLLMIINAGLPPDIQVNYIHLGSIFLMNLSIGFMMPPVGLNLMISSYAFNKPLAGMYKHILPFFAIQIVVLLLVTYIPWFSTCLVGAGY